MRLAAALLLGLALTVDAAEPILITAFEPFAGRGANGSATVARHLDGGEIAGHPVRIAVLPVRWGEPGARIPALIAEVKPILVIGLGEGHPGRIACETVAANEAKPFPDEAGALPAQGTLAADGPASRAATLRCDPAWFADPPVPVVLSQDAGGYLCNEALWVICGSEVPLRGFVHLPPQGEISDADYAGMIGPVVRMIVGRNLGP